MTVTNEKQPHPKVKLHIEHNITSTQTDGENGESTITKMYTEHVYCHRQEEPGVYEKDPWVILERKMTIKETLKDGEIVGEPLVERTQSLTGPGVQDGKIDFEPEDDFLGFMDPTKMVNKTEAPEAKTGEISEIKAGTENQPIVSQLARNFLTAGMPADKVSQDNAAKPKELGFFEKTAQIIEKMKLDSDAPDQINRVSSMQQTVSETLVVNLNEFVVEFFHDDKPGKVDRPNLDRLSASMKYPKEISNESLPSKIPTEKDALHDGNADGENTSETVDLKVDEMLVEVY